MDNASPKCLQKGDITLIKAGYELPLNYLFGPKVYLLDHSRMLYLSLWGVFFCGIITLEKIALWIQTFSFLSVRSFYENFSFKSGIKFFALPQIPSTTAFSVQAWPLFLFHYSRHQIQFSINTVELILFYINMQCCIQ